MNRGAFDRLVTFQRATVDSDDYGADIESWATLEEAWARVRFGRADEKREAAREGGTQTVTFEVVPTAALLDARLADRIQFDGSVWDITEVAPLERNLMRFTAIRAV